MPAAVFDQFARDYDEQFGGVIGGLFRRAVWRWLDAVFPPGERVLELGCGTGEDALHLAARGVPVLATDPSEGMLEVARRKVISAGRTDRIELRRLGIERVDTLKAESLDGFAGAFSSFGAFNLVADLPSAARALAAVVRPGGRVVLCLLGPLVPWEWAWFLARGRARAAVRRLRPGGAEWRGLKVFYPSVGRTVRAFAPAFRLVRAGGLGVLVPPPYAESWARKHAGLVARLDRWERRIETWPLVPRLGDHYILELQRQ